MLLHHLRHLNSRARVSAYNLGKQNKLVEKGQLCHFNKHLPAKLEQFSRRLNVKSNGLEFSTSSHPSVVVKYFPIRHKRRYHLFQSHLNPRIKKGLVKIVHHALGASYLCLVNQPKK